MADEVQISSYDLAWPQLFAEERGRLAVVLGPLAVRIDHVGSTAVAGLNAKPVIDIAIETKDFAAARASFPAILEPLGYAFWADNPDPDRLFFVKGLPPAPRRTHHVHVYPAGAPAAARQRAFRDRLAEDARLRDNYSALKLALAARFKDDREAYTAAKASFIACALGE